MDRSPSFVFFTCHLSSDSDPSPFLCSFGPKKALLAPPGDDDERQSGRVTAEWECRESLDVWTQLPVCSAAPPRSQTRCCWGSVLTGRRSLCSTFAKTNCVLSLQSTERDNSVRCVLDVFRSHSRARASPLCHICSWREEQKKRREEEGRDAAAAAAAEAFFKSRFEVLCTDCKSVICEHEWKE